MNSNHIAAVIADIDATIVYWRNRGVLCAWIAKELRCDANWPRIRDKMIAIALEFEAPLKRAA